MGFWQKLGTAAGDIGMNAVGGIVNAGINAALGDHERRENYRYNEMAAQAADKRQRAQFRDMYSYSAQIREMQKAGLNPALMYGGATGQGGATAPQGLGSGGVQKGYAPMDLLSIAQIENINADTEKKKAETENVSEDTNLKGQQILNLVADTNNKKVEHRLLSAEADLAELEFSVDMQTAQATIRLAYSNAEKAANQARSSAVQADLDEALFSCAYQMAYAELDNTLTDTALKKSGININKAQIKEIAERIRNSQWETWATEKEQNRKDAIFKLDQQRLQAECAKWAAEINVELTKAELEMVSDLVGYICNFATCGLSNATKMKQTEMYTETQKEIASKSKTTHLQNYHIDKKGRKVIHSGSYKKTD